MRTMLLCWALLGIAACGRKQPRPDEPAVDLPKRTTAAALEPAGPDSITITLTADGRILARGRAWTLEELEALLRSSVHREPGRFYASTVVRLRIDRAAPWLHIRWLAASLAEADADQARFVYADPEQGEADVPCYVWPSSILCRLPMPLETRCAYVRVIVGKDGKVYCGERAADDPIGVAAWMAEAWARVRQEKLSGIDAEIESLDGTPWGTVAAVYEMLRAGGARDPWFSTGYLGPAPEVKKLARLPAPPAEAPTRPVETGGIDVREDWGGRGRFGFVPRELPNEEPEPDLPEQPPYEPEGK